MYVGMYVFMYVFMYVRTHRARVYVCKKVIIYVCRRVCFAMNILTFMTRIGQNLSLILKFLYLSFSFDINSNFILPLL